MLNIKKILFPTDFSEPAEHAFVYAVDLAKRFQSELHIMHAIVNHTYAGYFSPDQESLYKGLRKNAEYLMEELVGKYDLKGLKVEKSYFPAISGSSMILDYADQYQLSLIVMGTHSRKGLSHLVLGSVAENIIRTANCPVLTVGNTDRTETDETTNKTIRNILVPIDFSEHSKKALSYAIELANVYDAKLQVLHVIDTPIYPAFYVMDQLSTSTIASNVKARAIESLAELTKEVKGVVIENYVTEGRAATDIAKFAEEQHNDLIVIASSGLTGMERFLLGSVTEKVVRLAKCPVFTVKPYGRQVIATA